MHAENTSRRVVNGYLVWTLPQVANPEYFMYQFMKINVDFEMHFYKDRNKMFKIN